MKNPKAYQLLLAFLFSFKDTELHVNNPKVSLVPIAFTDETEIEFPITLSKFFVQRISRKIGDRRFDLKNIEKNDEVINEFFSKLEAAFPADSFKDTRPDVLQNVRDFLRQKINVKEKESIEFTIRPEIQAGESIEIINTINDINII